MSDDHADEQLTDPDSGPASPDGTDVTRDPASSDSATSEPTDSEPVTSEPVTSEPVTSEPVTSEPVSLAKDSSAPSDDPEPASTADAATDGRRWFGRRTPRSDRAPGRKAPWWELPALAVLAVGIAILVKTFLVQPFYIPSASMENTLAGGPPQPGDPNPGNDRILVNKLIYDFRDPHPGDIVVFNAPPGWDDEPHSTPPSNTILRGIRGFGQLVGFVPPDGEVLVKRVIATGGQQVKGVKSGNRSIIYIKAVGSHTWRALDEPYVWDEDPPTDPLPTFGPVTVPKGRLWVMGDHRSDSQDSRYHCTPNGEALSSTTQCPEYAKQATVPVSDVIGKAFVVAWPPSHWRTLGTPKTFYGLAASLGPSLPTDVGVLSVAPVFLVRRRRRRRR